MDGQIAALLNAPCHQRAHNNPYISSTLKLHIRQDNTCDIYRFVAVKLEKRLKDSWSATDENSRWCFPVLSPEIFNKHHYYVDFTKSA